MKFLKTKVLQYQIFKNFLDLNKTYISQTF